MDLAHHNIIYFMCFEVSKNESWRVVVCKNFQNILYLENEELLAIHLDMH